MPLTAGAHLGPYEIVAQLGAGGMGTVYRARDTRLNRSVAIKVLSSEISDQQHRRRFLQEAQTISSLNHPHVLTVLEVGTFEGSEFLVTEFVDGGTLKDWLAPKRNWREVVEVLLGVADGLATAHAAGFLHRDVKPENILVGTNGYAKLADFGLAKALESLSDSNTRSVVLTRPGVVVGTIAYMSPEQASGKTLDERSDIFSFGEVLYEAVAGCRPFTGTNDLELLQNIIHGSPKPLDDALPVPLRLILSKALERNPADRYQSMRELVVDLRRLLRLSAEQTAAHVLLPRKQHKRAAFIGMAAIALLILLGIGAIRWFRAAPTTKTSVQVQRVTDLVGVEESPAISPDGKTVAFVARVNGTRQVWVRLLAGGVPLQLTHDDADHDQPRWAPDSSSLIYFSASDSGADEGTIWEIPALGGTPRRITSALSGGDISHDGKTIAAFRAGQPAPELAILTRDGSVAAKVPVHIAVDTSNVMPRWSPDDQWIAYSRVVPYLFDSALVIANVRTGDTREIVHGHLLQGHAWLPQGSGLVYSTASGSTVLYPPVFNLRVVSRTGDDDHQLTFGEVSYLHPDLVGGTIAASRLRLESDLWKIPVSGTPQQNSAGAFRITHQTGQVQVPSASPDGKNIVYLSDSGGHGNLWVVSSDGAQTRQITFERDPAVAIGVPVWSSTGDRIVFIRTKDGKTGEWLVNADGSDLHEVVPLGSGGGWSTDGQWLYYTRANCIEKVPVAGGAALKVRCEKYEPLPPSFSRDDSTMYFGIYEYGSLELQSAKPEGAPAKTMVRIPNARIPFEPNLWQAVVSPDGKWLAVPLWDRGTTDIWGVPTGGGAMRQLTAFSPQSTMITRRVSWSPDSKYIYMALGETDADIVLLDGLVR